MEPDKYSMSPVCTGGTDIRHNGVFVCGCATEYLARRIVAALKLTDHLSLESLESGKFAVGEVLDSTEPATDINAELVKACQAALDVLEMITEPDRIKSTSSQTAWAAAITAASKARAALANARKTAAVTR